MNLRRLAVGEFKYFVGVSSLTQIATPQDRICVLNILGTESSEVTPVGHAYSGGNVVFGTSPGRRGQTLATSAGDIPVYNNVREGLDDGRRFNCGVVYLPPAAARDGVAELIRVNPDLNKVFIITEKIAVHDAREIRAMGQANQVDIFGANCLGVADSWNRVRIGGALGGDRPDEVLHKGSIAMLSNSGGFTTTIAQYLAAHGWGTTTLISSGKDIYIHYAAPEFAFALANDARSKAAVLYVEPGGYYELDAEFTKPTVACVVGRWKAKLTRAVGHAGAMAGSGDDALAKERWFMQKFGVDGIYTPEQPILSARGALVTNIAHIPAALTAVMRENGIKPDFAPQGSLTLKPWFTGNSGLPLPQSLDLLPVEAPSPYNTQIASLNQQLGTVFARQSMKDASGASYLDGATQVAYLHGVSMLQATQFPLEANVALALLREPGGDNDRKLINVAIASEVNLHGDPRLAAAEAARAAGNSPNTILAAACCIAGPTRTAAARQAVRALIEMAAVAGIRDAADEHSSLDVAATPDSLRRLLQGESVDPAAQAMLMGLHARQSQSVFLRYLESLDGHPTLDGVRAAIAATLAWGPLMRKRISVLTAASLPWWMQLFGTLIGAAVPARRHEPDSFCGLPMQQLLERMSLSELAYVALLGLKPTAAELLSFQTLTGLLLTGNGPGAISLQGAKGAVSADGPESPDRVQLNKALVGFLTHAGYAHGGNGYEGIAFLIEQFRDTPLRDPGDAHHGIDLGAMAQRFAAEYLRYRTEKKAAGALDLQKIPGINHPVFKGKAVNFDPREVFVWEQMLRGDAYNIFQDYYRTLVQTLFTAGISRNVYCVNIDAVIATLLLKMLWKPFSRGEMPAAALESAAFTLFLLARMIGCAAEIDDHLNRGRDMDTRTPASDCRFVA